MEIETMAFPCSLGSARILSVPPSVFLPALANLRIPAGTKSRWSW